MSESLQTDIACAGRQEAAAEARRRQELEPDKTTVEWIYLHDAAGQWVARRTQRYRPGLDDDPPKQKSFLSKLFDVFMDLPG
jgi:hypothetical protein